MTTSFGRPAADGIAPVEVNGQGRRVVSPSTAGFSAAVPLRRCPGRARQRVGAVSSPIRTGRRPDVPIRSSSTRGTTRAAGQSTTGGSATPGRCGAARWLPTRHPRNPRHQGRTRSIRPTSAGGSRRWLRPDRTRPGSLRAVRRRVAGGPPDVARPRDRERFHRGRLERRAPGRARPASTELMGAVLELASTTTPVRRPGTSTSFERNPGSAPL